MRSLCFTLNFTIKQIFRVSQFIKSIKPMTGFDGISYRVVSLNLVTTTLLSIILCVL